MDCSDNTCLVCHETIEIYAIGQCDHAICFKCSTRLRALCDQFYCPICRTDMPEVFFMGQRESFGKMPMKSYIHNRKLKIQFETQEIREKFEILLEHRCKICKDKYPEKSFRALKDHMSRNHTLFYCNLCLGLKIFTSERKIYTRQELAAHRRLGDKDDTSYKGHPLCEFCDERYLDKDELYKHLRKDHYFCHFCESLGSQEFFDNYEVLSQHFQKEHFLCLEGECATAQFENAFRSRIDYQSHQVTHHSKAQNKQQSRQERTINIDINLVPRQTNRGRGMINGQDYEENRHGGAPRYQGGRGGKYKRNGDREDRDLDRAVQASLSTMKERKPKQKESEPAEEILDIKPDLRDQQNFPSLGATSADVPTSLPSNDMEISKASLADKVALANNMSVQHGVLGMEDFPDLNQRKPSKSATNTNLSRKSQQQGSRYSGATLNNKSVAEEYPELPKSKKPLREPSAKWKHPEGVNKKSSEKQHIVNKQQHQSDLSNIRKVGYNDSDFPSLGGNSGKSNPSANTKWFKPVENSTNNKQFGQRQSPSEDSSVPVSERFSPVNVPNSDKTKAKKKKKKDKAETIKEKENIKNNASLDNIASMLMSNSNSNSSDNVKASIQKHSVEDINKRDITDTVKKSISNKNAGNKQKKVDKIEKKMETEHSMMKSVESTIPNVDIHVSPTPIKFENETDDFPSLGAPSKPIRKPPGFQQSKQKPVKAPPGLKKTTVGAPPPGFRLDTDKIIPNNNYAPATVPVSSLSKNFEYSLPSEFAERNKMLIGCIQSYCTSDENRFTDFKVLSGEFRKGEIQASTYYQRCGEVLGKKNFEEIFPELLALLPSIEKQHQLLEVYMENERIKYDSGVLKISGKSRMAKGAWTVSDSGFLTCQTCKQVLVRKDYNAHLSNHSLDSDFPSLASDRPSQGFRTGSWVKAK